MEPREKTILVTGATGHQGGAAARHLLADGWHVRALTRDPNKAEARSLDAMGAEIVRADMLDRAAVDAAIEGVHGVYLMGTPQAGGPEVEERMDEDVVEAAAHAGIQHLVYSSVLGAGTESADRWIVAKTSIEQFIREENLPATIWRPSFFMENTLWHRDEILAGKFTGPDWPETQHPMIAVDDIGRFVALAFREPERYIGVTTTIAGDMLTFAEMADALAEVLGIGVRYEQVVPQGMPAPPRPAAGARPSPEVDVAACRELIPDLATFRQWVEATGWKAQVSARRG